MWRPSYDYLNDKEFLKEIDRLRVKEQHIKITALSWFEENPLQELQGYASGGTINASGKSAVRRTGSISLEADDKIYNIKDVNNIISINKKIAIEVGFTNTTFHYNEYDIIWIPLGVYIIKTASIDHGTNGLKISLSISDKMCLLNGDVGGIFPAAVNLSEVVILNSYGEKTGTDYIIIKDILKNMLCEYGGLQLGQIIIEDLDEIAKAQVKWNGDDKLYHYTNDGQHFYTTTNPNKSNQDIYTKGDLIGFRPQYFIWPGSEPLKANAGENVAAIVDKIAKALGIFEFYFDVYGFFHFRKKETYKNQQEFNGDTSIKEINYIPNKNTNIYSYEFNDAELVTAFKNNPQYMNIKNDFIVWGQKKNSGTNIPIRYHLVIDKKPSLSGNKYLFEYTGTIDKDAKFKQLLINKTRFDETERPYIDDGIYYGTVKEPKIYDKDKKDYVTIVNPKFAYFQPKDWRGELFVQSQVLGDSYFSNPYAAELATEFPKLYNFVTSKVDSKDDDYPVYEGEYLPLEFTDYNYFLDLIEPTDDKTNNISVSNIGRRTKVLNENTVNCIFSPATQIPEVAFIELGTEETNKFGVWAKENGYDVYQIEPEIFEQISISSAFNSAYDKIVDLLYTHSGYAETMSITTLPIYYLEPNTRIKVYDIESGIEGEYIAESFSLPLAANGTMTISCTKPLEKM